MSVVESGDLTVHCLLPFWPVRARACLLEHFWAVLSFGDDSFKNVLAICKESKIREIRVGGEHTKVVMMWIVGVHPVVS